MYASNALLVQEFVEGLDGIPAEAREALKQLTPQTYIGNAVQQARTLRQHIEAL